MKILFLSPVPVWPLKSGGVIRVHHLVKALSKNHQVTLVQFISHDEVESIQQEAEKICYKSIIIKRKYRPWDWQTLFKSLFSTRPLLVNLYDTNYDLTNLVNSADLIWVECFYLMNVINKFKKPVILGEQNIEYLAYQRYFDNLGGFKKIFLWAPMRWDLIKMKRWEKKMWEEAKMIVAVSQTDKQIIEEKTGRRDVTVIPNGVDTENFKPGTETSEKKTILFIGEYKWFPNREAINWLVKEIFPKIRTLLPEAKLLIVGRHMAKWLKKIKEARVDEEVEDIREAYRQAGIFLAPLKSGSGTKYKILEAMALGVPVLTTPVGVEGLGQSEKVGEIMIVKRKTEELVASAVDVLRNPGKYRVMSKNARKFVEENFDWKIIEEKLNGLLK